MTVKHMIDGIMRATGIHSQSRLETLAEMARGSVCLMQNGKRHGMRLEYFSNLQQVSRVPAETLLEWYRMPAGAVLGPVERISECMPTGQVAG